METLPPISLNRSASLVFYYDEGCKWLDFSMGGKNTSPLTYAAFEFRLAIERIGLELLFRVRGRQFVPDDYGNMRNYNSMQKVITSLAGKEPELARRIAFMNIIIGAIGYRGVIGEIKLGWLFRQWTECSELCHIRLNMMMQRLDGRDVFRDLAKIREGLKATLSSVIHWPNYHGDGELMALEKKFVKGEVTEEDIRSRLREVGVGGCIMSGNTGAMWPPPDENGTLKLMM